MQEFLQINLHILKKCSTFAGGLKIILQGYEDL
jgi:hypothetical protein